MVKEQIHNKINDEIVNLRSIEYDFIQSVSDAEHKIKL